MEISEKKLPLGLHEESTESLTAKKSYVSPNFKIVKFVVEVGVGPYVGQPFRVTGLHEVESSPSANPQGWNTVSGGEGWYISPNE